MNINDEWVRYLQGLGYTGSLNDMLVQALKDNSSATGQINDLWFGYLREQGLTGSLQDMMSSFLESKGYTGTLNDKWMQALENDNVFGGVVPPSCAITLNTDLAPALGRLGADISGQTVSKTVADVGEQGGYFAAVDFSPLWSSGIRIFEVADVVFTATSGSGQWSGLIAGDDFSGVLVGYIGGGTWVASLISGGATTATAALGSGITSTPAIGIDPSTGDVLAFIDGQRCVTGPFAVGGAAEGWFTAGQVTLGADLAFQSNGELSGKFVTDYRDFQATYTEPDLHDWCGNPLS